VIKLEEWTSHLLHHGAEGEQFALLDADELELLVDEVDGRVAHAHVDAHEVLQVAPAPVGHGQRVRGAEHGAPHLAAVARLVQFGQLLSETLLALLEQLVALVHHQPLHTAKNAISGYFHSKLIKSVTQSYFAKVQNWPLDGKFSVACSKLSN
jgi:hypothetical protein